MTSDRIAEFFKVAAKLVYLAESGSDYAAGVKVGVVAIQRQHAAASGAADPHRELIGFATPLATNTRQLVQALERLPQVARTGIDNYLRSVAPELGKSINDQPATILAAIKSAMDTSGDAVAPSGALYSYFYSGYGVALPQDDEPSIADEWISTTII